ncbi:hypothetical protein SLH46_12475 [Draconibacterium sp. IB214405]|uniref:hypothetical protein n=1 Tax=Draconibacterium sp. IB214405 TaxID=3097352 RepID=UPI002A14E020|nr:hypothetical protein [Draconibacterium sp. IB214405]MDX8340007.1 hypothetical protein [Draconibacterium sp. IB214405]
MWKGMIYKEWLKIRWFLLIYAGIGILSVVYCFIRVQHDITFSSPNGYWYFLLFMGGQYFSLLKFLPGIGALAIAIAQYFPETVSKRIKLTFHLPLNENKALLTMWLFGAGTLFISYLLQFLLFTGLSLIYFPGDIFVPAISSILPWFLAGFACYNLTALIVLEPVWKYRIFYLIVAVLFVPLLLQSALTDGFSPVNPFMAVLVLLSSFSLLFSGYRFRKGEM